MRVKRFVAPEVQEAMNKVRLELGDEAVILQVRQVKEGGVFGLFGRDMVEVTAALEDKKSPVEVPYPTETVRQNNPDISELRTVIEQMSAKLEEIGTKTKAKSITKLEQELLAKEIDESLVKRLCNKVTKRLGDCPQEQLQAGVAAELEMLLQQVKPIEPDGNKAIVVVLVGPTGVGKTTTIAKLAAHFAMIKNLRVALVTSDTYRVAAVDQLKTFAEIIRVPVEVTINHNSVQEAIRRHQDKDLILIDTAGRSPKNQIHMSELKTFLDKAQPDRVFLTISATTRVKDMFEIVDKFDLPCIDSLIFTKIDETSTLGAIVNVVNKTKKPLAYLTNGQNVPDDIFLANPHQLVQRILGGRAE